MVRAPKKALRIGRAALKTAVRLPAKVSGGSGKFSPLVGESPIVFLRVQVISCNDLLAKDKNGVSDPCVVLCPRHDIPCVLTQPSPALWLYLF